MKSGPEDMLGLRREGYRAGAYNLAWRNSLIQLDAALYRLRAMAAGAFRRRPAGPWRLEPSARVARYEALIAMVKDEIWLIGGITGMDLHTLTRIDIFNPKSGEWRPGPALPRPITHTVAAVDGGRIWVAGAFMGDHPAPVSDYTGFYDCEANAWRDGPPLPQATASAAVLRHGRRLHVIGGFIDRDAATGAHWALDLDAPDKWRACAPLPLARGHHGAVSDGRRIVVVGGQVGHDGEPYDVADVSVYDPDADAWSPGPALPTPRSHIETSTLTHDGAVIVAGGIDRARRLRIKGLDEVLIWRAGDDGWRPAPPLPVGLIGVSAAIADGRAYFMCGSDLMRPGGENNGVVSADISDLLAAARQAPEL